MWTFAIALVGICMTIGIVRQLYTAATRGYLFTGHSMSRKVYRDLNPKLFRSNVIANAVALLLIGGGSALVLADTVKLIGSLR